MFGTTDRRHFLKHVAGAAAIAGPGLTFLTNVRAAAAELKKNNKSLIILWMSGGPSTIDLWDMKPGSPNGGEHKPKDTAAAGVQISEYLPKVGKQFKNLSIIRSLTTSEGDHNRGTFLMSTGRVPNPISEFPHVGSVMSSLAAEDVEAMKHMDLPTFISVGGGRVGPGFLGMKYAPFVVGNPGAPPENTQPPQESASHMERRRAIFESMEGNLKTNVPADAVQAHKDVYSKAMQLVASSKKEVFQFNGAKDKDDIARYGDNAFGKGCLLAKRLVEAGVSCVEVNLGGWDMHGGIFAALKRNVPQLDGGMGSLVEDLGKSGRLKDTVIVWMGEFGRTPKINQNGGRDHFPRAWSVVVGGGKIKGGIAHGTTNADGSEVKDNPVKVGNLFATLYAGLGIDPAKTMHDNLGRRTTLAAPEKDDAVPVKDLIG